VAGGSEVLEARKMTFAALAEHCKETRYCEVFYDQQGRKLYEVREPKKFASMISRVTPRRANSSTGRHGPLRISRGVSDHQLERSSDDPAGFIDFANSFNSSWWRSALGDSDIGCLTPFVDALFTKGHAAGSPLRRITSELTRRGEVIQPSPHQSSYEALPPVRSKTSC